MEANGVLCTSPQQFQQPSNKLFHDTYNSEVDTSAAEIRFSYQYLDRMHGSEEENSYMYDDDHDSLQIMKGFLQELDANGHKMFKKLLSRVERDIPIDRPLRETLHDFRGKHGSDVLEKFARKLNKGFMSTDRGVDGATPQEELEHKLERFKVKIVNTIGSGVVKEEGR